jgi:5-methylcytosine-specific restriction endonuclease McrA
MSRREFSKSVRLAAWERCKGHCETCGQKIVAGVEYDHALENYVGGMNDLANCVCLCVRCHRVKTKTNRPQIDKTRRIYEKRAGVRDKRRGFKKPPSGYNAWSRSIDR